MKKFFTIITLSLLLNNAFAQEIKIMTWNIFMIPPIIFKSCQEDRAVYISDYVKKMNPDIMVFNEAFLKNITTILKDKLTALYPYQSDVTPRGAMKLNSGVLVFSKFPILKQDFVQYKSKRGSDRFAKKGARYVELAVNNQRIQLVTTHTQSLVKYSAARIKQFTQLKNQLLDKYYQDSIPQFIVGDLNCNYYDTSEYNIMIKTLDVLPVAYSGERFSWNGVENDLAYKFSEHTQETLDYILLRNSTFAKATIKSTEILKPSCGCTICKYKFNSFSDHSPVISTIELK